MSLRDDVEDALTGYALAYDEAEIDGIVDSFTADGRFVTSGGAVTVEGAEALRTFFIGARGSRSELGQQPRHLVTNLRVEADGDQAVARSYMTLIVTDRDGHAAVECTGRYRDILVQDGGRWRFAERNLTFDAVSSILPAE